MNTQTRKLPALRRRRRGGFTLIELLLVLVILAVLAVVVVPKFTGRSQQAKVSAAMTDISRMQLAIGMFEIDCDRYPTTTEGLKALLEEPTDLDEGDWKGPYLERERGTPVDPWKNPYAYERPGRNNPRGYDLYSYGPDKKQGGGDDIGNWNKE